MFKLNIKERDSKANLGEIREAGNIPAIFYGNDVKPTSIVFSASEFKSVWKQAGSSSLISLSGIGEDKEAVIQDMDIDPITSQVRHIDFYVTKKGQKMETTVSLEFVGVSSAVKELGGILVKVMRELNIEVFPKDLPQHVEVDISLLKELDSQISIKDLKLPEGVKSLDDENEVVAAVSQAKEEEVSEPVDIADVEIEKKGKKEEDEETEEQKNKET